MNRRAWLRTVVSPIAAAATIVFRGQTTRGDPRTANLNETLRSALKCRRQEEFDFVDRVTQKVEQGQLPLDLVLSMMKWAVLRRSELPFPYFKEGLKRRAAALGVAL